MVILFPLVVAILFQLGVAIELVVSSWFWSTLHLLLRRTIRFDKIFSMVGHPLASFLLAGLGLTALVVVCGSLGRYAQQDFLLKIAFFALCVLLGGQLHVALCVLLGGQLQHVH